MLPIQNTTSLSKSITRSNRNKKEDLEKLLQPILNQSLLQPPLKSKIQKVFCATIRSLDVHIWPRLNAFITTNSAMESMTAGTVLMRPTAIPMKIRISRLPRFRHQHLLQNQFRKLLLDAPRFNLSARERGSALIRHCSAIISTTVRMDLMRLNVVRIRRL